MAVGLQRNYSEDPVAGVSGPVGAIPTASPMAPTGPARPQNAPSPSMSNGRYFAQGGAVDDGSDDGSGFATALQSVDQVMDYGYKKYGQGGQQEASNMPAIPGSQSNSGIPPVRPEPGPLPPTSNPFGRRPIRPMGQAEGSFQTAGRMPAVPGSQSDSGIPPIRPEPGPLPPTSNPFGRRESRPLGQHDDDEGGAIDTENA